MHQPYPWFSTITPDTVDNLLAFHRSQFGDARMENEGGAPAGEGGTGAPAAPAGGGDGDKGAPAAPPADLGFPADTPVKDMSPEQQAAYWRDKSQKHEKLWKSVEGVTPQELAALREKAEKHDQLERDSLSDKDKAILEARESATREANAKAADKLVRAEFKSAAAGRIDADRLKAILEPLDMSKFLDASGEVDEAKVATFVDGVAPKAASPKGPSSGGLGSQSHSSGEPGAAGRAMAEKRFGKSAVS